MSRSSVVVFAKKEEWSVIVIENDGESSHPFRFQKHAASFANGQRARLGFPMIDFAACGNANLPVAAR
nr:hypothetical protein [uncultured Shinella sp.]